ncbi:DUF6268 family outer membrane beta-barrel protein [Flavobacterium sp. ASW18X]|uniref:DUF6268 family outer membrane beta-barrel protein n=1 Tax=Flavobacterium sp. ASW18X TaxID=2572595 RepID=UPI0010AE77F1|nr:DUF6268 family outer membrane beta-barrel protein [Flavobacterium sp. ASW18X]TKD61366.1 hypothetical protein FBT53_11315 [Flavobacterium sp. ASW18X]
MQKKIIAVICCVVCIFLSLPLIAQSTDVLKIEYLNIPKNLESGIVTERLKVGVNIPLKVNNDSYFVVGGEYNQFGINFDKVLPFSTADLSKLYITDLNLGYITKWNDNWRLVSIATPRLASNLTEGTSTEDFFFNATVAFWKENNKANQPYRIVLGLSYNSTTGLPIPLPLVSYYKRYHPNWSYTLGIPKTNFKYHSNKNHVWEMALLLDGYFINIQNDIALDNGQVGSKISLSAAIATLGYQYKLNKNMAFYAYVGHSVYQESILRDNSRNDVFLLNSKQNLFLRGGFKIGIF